MIGQKFNKWTVLSYDSKNKNGNFKYKCVCDCGKESVVIGSHLRNNQSTQCKSCSSKINGRLGLDSMSKQHLYMVSCGEYLKIGSTDNIERRFRDLSNSCPYPLKLEYIGVDEGFLEPIYHSALSDYRIHGEWFKL
jgi:DNA-directed RNA polymerase subunit RPC12/RpoP